MTLPNPKVLQPGCTATTNRNQACEMLLHKGVEAYKKEGPKFMQRLVATQKARVRRLEVSMLWHDIES